MPSVQKIFNASTRICTSGALWLILTGQSIRNRRIAPGKIELDYFQFKSGAALSVPNYVYVLALCVVLAIAGGLYFLKRVSKKRNEKTIVKISEEKANLRLDVTLTRLRIPESSRLLIGEIAETVIGSTEPQDVLPMVESIESFEKVINQFKKENDDPDLMKAIGRLRHELKFEFLNKNAPFVSTQM